MKVETELESKPQVDSAKRQREAQLAPTRLFGGQPLSFSGHRTRSAVSCCRGALQRDNENNENNEYNE